MAKNIIEKIWDEHVVLQEKGKPAIFGIDLHLIHEVTSAQAFSVLRERKLNFFEPHRALATVDHSIPTRLNRHEIFDEMAKKQIETLRKNVKDYNIPFYDMDSGNQGIVHVVGPELGLTQPGMTIVCGDSHTSTHGAFGAIAFGIGTTEVSHVMATSCILQKPSKTMKVNFKGKMKKEIFSKDLILALIAKIGVGGANSYIIEYTGEAIKDMSMEARMTICNMSIECGARAGLIGPDEITIEYLKGRSFSPKNEEFERAKKYWLSLQSDKNCKYDKEIEINVDDLEPMVTWGTNPEQCIKISEKIPYIKDLPESARNIAEKSLDYTKLKEGQNIKGVTIDYAFIGSCTNGRIEDLRIAANILKGRKVHKNVKMLITPGSEAVRDIAKIEGLYKIFIDAGAEFRMPGCSMCLGMNDDKVPSGKRCISSTNRNFVGRQGTGSITHLASPALVSASAIEGKITNPKKFL
ncbi:3-isopropylmalate dehydratase large subunit [Candidatus Peregrinibacteria bacterium RIFOXYC2_FULL_33_13]|nr:MAG: 3-isopropylmalate dehydratase, large subunit [Candidatus Peregrinibacteria bacterium GW2011_GWA2_33_10]KKP41287.1 MAG: isopropylmalate isomerase large subunit, 3-isopropylmalate/(R)-2-methylmalate dehydratase large subunit [Candidatus Peregrinibacteria bacterium GW2011_GWC2_33_13]OGJ47468.1 MAG: 3-isopropylmalate dehydratase large subunit [Candidatus Peregrinibacteria bacterium RIFOXYA2_FULL_33_7]OGJ53789.1 MAG: 3-isopropylmalate dehydratase large subunit [Candidatus Peregrinibacteria ba